MRRLVTVTLAGLLLAEPVSAQGYRQCIAPAEPAIPSGLDADRQEMEDAGAAVTRYVEDVQEYLRCMTRNVELAKETAERLSARFQQAIDDYNSR